MFHPLAEYKYWRLYVKREIGVPKWSRVLVRRKVFHQLGIFVVKGILALPK
jgi:hypothetical protein